MIALLVNDPDRIVGALLCLTALLLLLIGIARNAASPPTPKLHTFRGHTQPIFLGDDPDSRAWPLRLVVCTRCGVERQVSWMLDPTTIRSGGCR